MRHKVWLGFTALVVASLACSIFIGGPAYPAVPVAVSSVSVQSLHDQVRQAVATGAVSNSVTFTITQEQLTSYLAAQLQSQPNPIVTDPQVILLSGEMQVFGKVQQGVFVANASLTMTVSVDADGLPKIQITQQDFGPFPAPQGLNQAVNALLAEALTGSLGPVATGFRLASITIADGVMTVSGRIK